MSDQAIEVPPVLLLAAGKGTRLGELGKQRLKVLVEVAGRPLLDWHLEHLAAHGARRVILNAHHLKEQLLEYVGDYRGPLELQVLVEDELLGTAGAALNARERLGASRLLVLYGDVMLFEPLRGLLGAHDALRPAATLCVYAHERTQEKGVVILGEGMGIAGFAEKDAARSGPGLINAGLYVVEPELLADYQTPRFLDFGHDVFPAALARGLSLRAYLLQRPVLDIGTPEALAQAGLEPRPGERRPS